MIQEIFHVLLWVTVVMLVISGLDDLLMSVMYWFFRRKYKSNLPSFSEINTKTERSIAIMIGAWREEKVIGRTLTIALKKLRYTNFRIFVAVYPNDLRTIKVVRDIARKDHRVVLCLNPQDGPTTKADNLNNSFTCIKEYERQLGEFDIILIHDSEDFIHPLSLKLFNYLIMYKGNYAVQIPVIPIKSKLGKLFHRTNCDAFAELHTKDMIVRQSIGSYIPFAGTGMAFNRKAFHYLESKSVEEERKREKYYKENKIKRDPKKVTYMDEPELLKQDELAMKNNSDEKMYADDPYPQYEDIPIPGWDDPAKKEENMKKHSSIKQYSVFLSVIIVLAVIFSIYVISASSIIASDEKSDDKKEIVSENQVEEEQVENSNRVKDLSEYQVVNRISDAELNVTYEQLKNGTYRIQESVWESHRDADDRLHTLKRANAGDGISMCIIEVESDVQTWHKIYLSEFNSLEEAKQQATKMRLALKSFNNQSEVK